MPSSRKRFGRYNSCLPNQDSRHGQPKQHQVDEIFYLRSKNQLPRLPPMPPAAPAALASCAWIPLNTGMFGPPAPFAVYSLAPPPRSGFAIRGPAPPKFNPPEDASDKESPRVEPVFAASSRSLTAASCASKLRRAHVSQAEKQQPARKDITRTGGLHLSVFPDFQVKVLLNLECARFLQEASFRQSQLLS